MKVLIAKTSGFCGGVKRAMRIALDAARDGDVWADGPLVHNSQALELLELHGVVVSPEPGPGQKNVLVRAHGVAPDRRAAWLAKGLGLVDATCVHVARNQQLAADADGPVILAGDAGHAEVLAVAAAAKECVVVRDLADIENLPGAPSPALMLAQTTFNVELFHKMAVAARRRFPGLRVVDSICRSTHVRQEEARRLADLVEVMVVVGGCDSANTKRLADMAREAGKPVFLVETAADLRAEDFVHYRLAGVTSGASTPGWVTQDVVNRLKDMGRGGALGTVLRLLRTLVAARVATALSGGGLALAAQFQILGTLRPELALAGAGYIFFAHTLNRRLPPNPEARRLTRADLFYQRQRGKLLPLAWLAAVAALLLSAFAGWGIFLLFFALFSITVAYTRIARRIAVRAGAGQYPVLRTLVMAAGWGVALAGPPWLEGGGPVAGGAAFLFVSLICFGGALIRDLHDISSDRLMGLDTLPARLGMKRASFLVVAALTLAGAIPAFLALGAVWSGTPFFPGRVFLPLLMAAPVWGRELLDLQRRGTMHDTLRVQACVDSIGCLAGLSALAGFLWAG